MRVGGDIHVGSDPISAEYHHVNMTSHWSWTRNNQSREREMEEKEAVCGFCPFFWRSSVRQHSLRVTSCGLGGDSCWCPLGFC